MVTRFPHLVAEAGSIVLHVSNNMNEVKKDDEDSEDGEEGVTAAAKETEEIPRKDAESSTNTHTVQEFGSPEHRDTASSNANKFNFAIDEENIDFNISGVPNAMVKRSHGINIHNLIQQIENHPQRQALQSDLQQH